jgi:NADH dehydrogenase (ubiquinone) Fe-S protein 1
MGKPLPYSSLVELRHRMSAIAPHLADNEMGVQAASAELSAAMLGSAAAPAGSGKPSAAPLKSIVTNFYMTDPVSRASATMAKCVETFGTRV